MKWQTSAHELNESTKRIMGEVRLAGKTNWSLLSTPGKNPRESYWDTRCETMSSRLAKTKTCIQRMAYKGNLPVSVYVLQVYVHYKRYLIHLLLIIDR
jgi:hypothetical protein